MTHRCDDCDNFLARDGSIIEPPSTIPFANESQDDKTRRWNEFWRSGVVVNSRKACDPEHPFKRKV